MRQSVVGPAALFASSIESSAAATEHCAGWRAPASRCSRTTGSCASSARSRDITDQHRVEAALRESERRFATLAEGSPVLLWVNGLEGGEFVNRAYLDFVGRASRTRRCAVTTGAGSCIRPIATNISTPIDARSPRSRVSRPSFVFAVTTANTAGCAPTRRRGSVTTASLEGYVGATVDITERRNAEDALRVADRHKDEFLAMLAHELRNPLAPIRNASEVLALRYGDDPQAAGPIAMLRRQSDHLARLLDDLLDVTRIAQGRVTLKHEPLEIGSRRRPSRRDRRAARQGEVADFYVSSATRRRSTSAVTARGSCRP